jgi:hypothetical protein
MRPWLGSNLGGIEARRSANAVSLNEGDSMKVDEATPKKKLPGPKLKAIPGMRASDRAKKKALYALIVITLSCFGIGMGLYHFGKAVDALCDLGTMRCTVNTMVIK